MADDFKPRRTDVNIPNPPRQTGQTEQDMRSIIEFLTQFFRTTVLETGLLDPNYQASGADFEDLSQLPIPEATTIARAQKTANLIVKLYWPEIQKAERQARQRVPYGGTLTISGADDTATTAFDAELPDANYRIALTCTGYTGNPATNSFIVIQVQKTAGGFAFETLAAPGAGATVVWDWLIVRPVDED